LCRGRGGIVSAASSVRDHPVADAADPIRLLPAYDSGDHLHPGAAGYQAMGDAIDLSELT
jgi:lysophospholipase L1-like esterase